MKQTGTPTNVFAQHGSDHSAQIAHIQLTDTTSGARDLLNVKTFNMMTRMNPGNNGFNQKEPKTDHINLFEDVYVKRQIKLARKLDDEAKTDGTNVIFIQEGPPNGKESLFAREMSIRGWHVESQPDPKHPSQTVMILVHRDYEFQYIEDSARSIDQGMECDIILPHTHKKVTLTNLHVGFGDRQTFKNTIASSLPRLEHTRVIAGDMNIKNIPGSLQYDHDVSTCMAYRSARSNHSIYDDPQDRSGNVLPGHDQNTLACYDQFVIIPSNDVSVSATLSGDIFVDNGQTISVQKGPTKQFSAESIRHLSQTFSQSAPYATPTTTQTMPIVAPSHQHQTPDYHAAGYTYAQQPTYQHSPAPYYPPRPQAPYYNAAPYPYTQQPTYQHPSPPAHYYQPQPVYQPQYPSAAAYPTHQPAQPIQQQTTHTQTAGYVPPSPSARYEPPAYTDSGAKEMMTFYNNAKVDFSQKLKRFYFEDHATAKAFGEKIFKAPLGIHAYQNPAAHKLPTDWTKEGKPHHCITLNADEFKKLLNHFAELKKQTNTISDDFVMTLLVDASTMMESEKEDKGFVSTLKELVGSLQKLVYSWGESFYMTKDATRNGLYYHDKSPQSIKHFKDGKELASVEISKLGLSQEEARDLAEPRTNLLGPRASSRAQSGELSK